ncbi:3-deoxy-8-phosphooctulonate synthase [Candidatus Omnitrophota bacterium]
MDRAVRIKNISISSKAPLVLIAGPCVIEDEKSCIETAKRLKQITSKLHMPFIFKSSYDKANRSSIKSFRGVGLKKGIVVLKEIKRQFNIPVLSDVHSIGEVEEAAKVLDVIQIPAFLSRQTDLIVAAARTKKIINVKKGQFLAPWDMVNVIKKIESAGNKKILITERGTSFGYNNLVSDFRSLVIMRKLGYPVIYDATHSVQLPGGAGDASSGKSEFVPYLSRAAVAVGCAGLFLEVHPYPKKALSDGSNMLALNEIETLLRKVKAIDRLIK